MTQSKPGATPKIVLVTGATAGIGKAAALRFARGGFRVIATGRREERLHELKCEAGSLPLETMVLDVDHAEGVARAYEEVLARTNGHGVDVLVNNAGFGQVGPLEEVSDADLRAQFETNVFGLMRVTRAFLPGMRHNGWGRVINVSSIAGRTALPFWGAYNGTKYALEGMSDSLRREVRRFGVRVILIEPGAIQTQFTVRADAERGRYVSPLSPYATAMKRYPQLVERFYRLAPGPDPVARAIWKAATARWPRARYVVPRWNHLHLLLATRTPPWLLDRVERMLYGL
jgi:NAD(P)-dependent dehydrogenase (short-subunit alcohol dehydrogenase family)